MILAGDIGGTNTRLGLFDAELEMAAGAVWPSREHGGLEEIVRRFLDQEKASIGAAAFGVAGPVLDGRCQTTNLPWIVAEDALASELGLERKQVRVINDLEATAWGIPALGADDLEVLHSGSPVESGNAALIAAGTGLGEAGLVRIGEGFAPYASEGGHVDFSPRNDLEIELLRFLREDYGRVSWERVVSGPGLANIYRFLRQRSGQAEPDWLAAQIRTGDPTPAISAAGLDGSDAVSAQALDLFVSLYGAEAGNLALKMMATGGLYVGGGIAPKVLPRLRAGLFLAAFVDKGRLKPLLERIPVTVIRNDRAALLGAARRALAVA